MKFGTSYYPEITDPSEWEQDLLNMREAALTILRIGEFAWSALEPREGEYQFDWLTHFLDLAHRHGFEVILCTPTATPPAWLGHQYPEIFVELADGTRRRHGGRRDMDLDNEIYRHYCVEIVSALGRHFGPHPAVIGWQIDNELFGVEGPGLPPGCHTAAATFRFRQYLKRVHGDLATLNRRWGTRFWSHEYSTWAEIETARHPRTTAGQWLDYLRWFNESLAGFIRLQADALRRVVPAGHFITHNTTAVFDRGTDHFQLAESLDVAGWDAYYGAAGHPHPAAFTALAHDLFRSIKRAPFLVLETNAIEAGPARSPAFFAEMKARGAAMAVIWHWRGHRSGAERGSDTFCDHAGRPCPERTAFLRELATRPEMQTTSPPAYPKCKAAILLSTDTVADDLRPNPYRPGRGPLPSLRGLIATYAAFRKLGVPMDVVRPGEDLSGYQLLALPSVKVMDQTTAAWVETFVSSGATLFALAKLAHLDRWGAYHPVPGSPLERVLGLTVPRDLQAPAPLRISMDDGTECDGGDIADFVEVGSAEIIARFVGESWDGRAAATVNTCGSGRAFYVATLADTLIQSLAEQACRAADLPLRNLHPDLIPFPDLEGRGQWLFHYGSETIPVADTEIFPHEFHFQSHLI